MLEVPQGVANPSEASTVLYDLIEDRDLVVYRDPDQRPAVSRAVAVETTRGW